MPKKDLVRRVDLPTGSGRSNSGGSTNASSSLVPQEVNGVVRGVAGDIAGFKIDIVLGLYAGADETRVQMAPGKGFWSGASLIEDAPYSVTPAGHLKATDVSIRGILAGVLDSPILERELMKLSFASISWAQFAIFDGFADELKRDPSDPSLPKALVKDGKLYDCMDLNTASSGFRSKTYTGITTVLTGATSNVSPDIIEDYSQLWFEDQYKGFVVLDSSNAEYVILGCSALDQSLHLDANGVTPAAGFYTVYSRLPSYCVAFMSYSDSSNGGNGSILLEVTFNNGVNWQTFYSTGSVDRLGGTVEIAVKGRDYGFRISFTKNSASDVGPEVYGVLVCTDPPVWG
jgi:hypothetical protein